jgi:hypothetical protein
MDRFAAMEAFVRVVEAGSFSGAAKQQRLGQPAVSKTRSSRTGSARGCCCVRRTA